MTHELRFWSVGPAHQAPAPERQVSRHAQQAPQAPAPERQVSQHAVPSLQSALAPPLSTRQILDSLTGMTDGDLTSRYTSITHPRPRTKQGQCWAASPGESRHTRQDPHANPHHPEDPSHPGAPLTSGLGCTLGPSARRRHVLARAGVWRHPHRTAPDTARHPHQTASFAPGARGFLGQGATVRPPARDEVRERSSVPVPIRLVFCPPPPGESDTLHQLSNDVD